MKVFKLHEYVEPKVRVSAGAAWMDDNKPDWFTGITDPKTHNAEKCILCQLAEIKSYSKARNRFRLTSEEAVLFGFDKMLVLNKERTACIEGDEVYATLDALWMDEVTARLELVSSS